MVIVRKIPPEELPEDWSGWTSAHFQSEGARDGFLDSVADCREAGWTAEAMTRDARGALVRWRRGSFLRLNDLAYQHGGRIVVG